jgi:CHAT domain-containing protein
VLEYVLWDAKEYAPIRGNFLNMAMRNPPAVNSYCLVLTKDRVRAVKLDPSFDYAGTVDSLRKKIIPLENGDIAELEDFEAERNALYQALIEPVLEYIPPETIKSLLIVPDGSLAFLPFDILRKGKDSPKDLDLGEAYRVSLSPSVSVSFLASQREEPADEPFLGFGGAIYKYIYGTQDDGRPMYWDELGQSAVAVTDIKDNYFGQSSRVIRGREASEGRVKAMSEDGSLADYPIIHFDCHGYFNEREPEKSGILLSRVPGEE